MALNEAYRRQVALLIKTVPLVAAGTCFALKGGTAINLFVRDMPRLSVDIESGRKKKEGQRGAERNAISETKCDYHHGSIHI